MELRDSRRLTGPNFIWERPGAVLDILLDDGECQPRPRADGGQASSVADAVIAAWTGAARSMLDALGWQAEQPAAKRVGVALEESEGGGVAQGLSLAISAPLDVLYTACSVNEWALDAAVAALSGQAPSAADFEAARARLAAEIAEESNPPLIALRAAAHEHDVCFLSDDDEVSVGMGSGSRTWPVRELPAPEAVDWSTIGDRPHVVVTGTNGKSTTVRLLAAMVSADGGVPGISSTDFVRVGDEVLDQGDWSGPGGGRMLLRDPRVTVGLLETARGGMLRRGLALERTDLAVLLNVGADHLSEWGTPDLASLTDAKCIPVRVARRAVLNADDPEIIAAVERGLAGDAERIWFSLEASNPLLCEHLARGGRGAWLADDKLWISRAPVARASDSASGASLAADDSAEQPATVLVAALGAIPMTLGGAARYNVSNALAAVAAGVELGLPVDAIRAGLEAFESGPADNPGRLNRFELGGVTALVDFAHNPEGVAGVCAAAMALPAERRLVLLGQAGDRDDASTREMVRSTAGAGLDHIIIKELTEHLRGRELGRTPALIEAELRALGLDESSFSHAPDELSAVRQALAWARPGDLLLLLAHDFRDEVLALVQGLAESGWVPGEVVA